MRDTERERERKREREREREREAETQAEGEAGSLQRAQHGTPWDSIPSLQDHALGLHPKSPGSHPGAKPLSHRAALDIFKS